MLLAGTPKQRRKILVRVDSGVLLDDLDSRFVERVPASLDRPLDVTRLLRERGAGPYCRVVSPFDGFDGRDMSLEEALEALVPHASGFLVLCVPGRLAYCRGELGPGSLSVRG